MITNYEDKAEELIADEAKKALLRIVDAVGTKYAPALRQLVSQGVRHGRIAEVALEYGMDQRYLAKLWRRVSADFDDWRTARDKEAG
jgi:hypothetical protein